MLAAIIADCRSHASGVRAGERPIVTTSVKGAIGCSTGQYARGEHSQHSQHHSGASSSATSGELVREKYNN